MTIKKIAPAIFSLAILLAITLPMVLVHADTVSVASGGLQNPIKVNSIGEFFYMVANFAYSLSYAVIAFFLIWSGFKFVVAQGNEEKLSDAKKTFYYTIIGAILLIGANVITEVVRTVINQFSKTQV